MEAEVINKTSSQELSLLLLRRRFSPNWDELETSWAAGRATSVAAEAQIQERSCVSAHERAML